MGLDELRKKIDQVDEKIVELLWHLAHDDNYLVIIVTHDLGITKVADEVMQMTDGYLVPMVLEDAPIFQL